MLRPIKGYEAIYSIDENGKVWSWQSSRFLKPGLDTAGYYQVSFTRDKKAKMFKLHRLLMLTFKPTDKIGVEVNHIDGVKTNNNLDNLEWVSHRDNVLHSMRNGLQRSIKLSKDSVIKIRELKKTGGYNNRQLAEMFGISREHARDICLNKTRVFV